MSDKVIVRQNQEFETEIIPSEAFTSINDQFQLTGYEHSLTPGQLLLASLGACTAMVLHTYAQNQNLELHQVEIELWRERVALKDQEGQGTEEHRDKIYQKVKLTGSLDMELKKRIHLICRRCSIFSLLEHGISIESEWVPA